MYHILNSKIGKKFYISNHCNSCKCNNPLVVEVVGTGHQKVEVFDFETLGNLSPGVWGPVSEQVPDNP